MENVLLIMKTRIRKTNTKSMLESKYNKKYINDQYEMLKFLHRYYHDISAIILETESEVELRDVLKAIRQFREYQSIPIIIVVDEISNELNNEYLELGANGIVARPFTEKVLLKYIDNMCAVREKNFYTSNHKDKITGLLGREYFFEECDRLLENEEAGFYTMSCMDIDNFKVINDQYGMVLGDEVLKQVAKNVSECIEQIGGLACRFTADRFAILYPASYRNSDIIVQNHKKVMEPDCIDRTVRVRIGRYIAEDSSIGAKQMYERATIAEESMKGRYDIYVCEYDDSMRTKLLREQEIVSDMNRALEASEFIPFFQPQYNHATKALIGAEALVRWKKADKFVSPGEFIPIFERNGFVYELDKCIWEKVCILLRKWMDEDKNPLPVSVNISRFDLYKPDFLEVICGLVEKYQIPTDLLRLEVTESAFADSPKKILEMVNQLISYGFTVEIDDFGSGYSSLNTLKDVPASILKLDMKFFETTSNSVRSGNIVESVVRMAKWLGMAVIAEGVEEIEQADFLQSIGCYYIQGYLYARPMPVDDYEKLLVTAIPEKKLTRLQSLVTLDNNEFWNPKSMETLIFNSYVGGACIFEYYKGNIELMRVNEQYTRELGHIIPPDANFQDMNTAKYLDGDNLRLLFRTIKHVIRTKKEASCSLILKRKGYRAEYIRYTLREIASAGERFLFYCVMVNRTKQHNAELSEKMTASKMETVLNRAGNGITSIIMHKNSNEFILANDRYYEILGYTREEYDQIFDDDVFSIIYPDDRQYVMNQVLLTNGQKGEVTLEYRIIRKDKKVIWVKNNIKVMNLFGIEDPVQVAVFTDITEEKEAYEQLQFLNDSAHDILATNDPESAITGTLEKLISHFAGDRSYIIEINQDTQISTNTYEICKSGIKSEKEFLQYIPCSEFTYILDILENEKIVYLSDVDNLNNTSIQRSVHDILDVQGIHSIIMAPLLREGKMIGMVGVDNPTQSLSQIDRMVALGDYLAILLTKRDLNETITEDNNAIRTLMNDTPGGFCKMRIYKEKSPELIYVNEGFCHMLGMSLKEVLKKYKESNNYFIYDEDIMLVEKQIRGTLHDGAQFSSKVRLIHKDGTLKWTMFIGRFSFSKTGEIFLNSYYADLTEQMEREQKQRELLDNMPCGAALFEYDGKRISIIHINRKYWELVEREPSVDKDKNIMNEVYPDDVMIATQEIEAAIRQKRDVSCDIRIRCGQEGYRAFHVEACITKEANGKYILYTSYNKISDEKMSIQEILPVAMSTLMKVSDDFAYMKDRDLHYICCSDSVANIVNLNSARDIIGKTDYDLFEEPIADAFITADKKVLSSGQALVDTIEEVTDKNNVLHYMTTSKYPLKDMEGTVIGIYGVARDITETKEQESQLQMLTDSIPGGLASFAIINGKIETLFLNEGFYKPLGYNYEEYKKLTADSPFALMLPEDRMKLHDIIHKAGNSPANGMIYECEYRCLAKDGTIKWMSLKSRYTKMGEDQYVLNVVQLDITEQKLTEENLRLAEEEYHYTALHSGRTIGRYNIEKHTLKITTEAAQRLSLPEYIEDVPYGRVKLGKISENTKTAYIQFYEEIMKGKREGTVTFQKLLPTGWRWINALSTTIFNEDGKPVSAIISYMDVTDQYEKEAIYRKWQQSIEERSKTSYSLFCCDISPDVTLHSVEGTLIHLAMEYKGLGFSESVEKYAQTRMLEDDRTAFINNIDLKKLVDNYAHDKRNFILEFREIVNENEVRWIRLTVDLVERPDMSGILAYFMFENIDESKKAELTIQTLAETDVLTGLLNRKAFEDRLNEYLSKRVQNDLFAFCIMDMDGFKKVNDTLGHFAGDQLLIQVGRTLKSALHECDLVGRLGGDEFIVCMCNIPSIEVIRKKVRRIWKLTHYEVDEDIKITSSMGVAISPDDGNNFETLYHKADKALYRIKESGKDNYGFYRGLPEDYVHQNED